MTGKVGKDLASELGLRLLQQNLPGGTGTTYVSIAGYTQWGESQEEPLTQGSIQSPRCRSVGLSERDQRPDRQPLRCRLSPWPNHQRASYGRITSLNGDYPLRRIVLGGRLAF